MMRVWLSAVAVLAALFTVTATDPFTVRFQVSNLDGESTTELHDFYVEVHPDWVRCYGRLASVVGALV